MDDESPTKPRSKRDDDAQSVASSPADTAAPDETTHADADNAADADGDAAEVKKEGDDEDAAETRPKYRSWKKKWRKLRVTFDQKMHEAEVLWLREQKAKATIKRIAIENEYQRIPHIPEKRVAIPTLSSDPPEPSDLLKTLVTLESEVPHLSYEQAKDTFPDALLDITPAPGEDEPATFLTVDEIENYIYEIDLRLGLPKLNSLASAAKDGAPPSALPSTTTRDFLVKHPHSAYNWLKANAPHVFLQGGEAATAHDDDDHAAGGAASSRKKGGKTDKSAKPAKSKRQSKADRLLAEQKELGDVSMGEDDNYATPAAKKRKRDDDGGYRPKGGSSTRPAKKKRKSDVEGTPLANKKRKVAPED
ncbi:hypothetical protein jhhlp_007623 [Lomentospora prolificans]|uniref:Uncharacterized protein n=1 Tax=Lomentospora prolificans TaxID=41688 RepID=A0A2N3N022_9PEZI|nr:hypothetical protein jhhlp_007623 [Lomentospora prolificans]